MNLDLVYPEQQEGFSFENLQMIPDKHNQFSGYYLIAYVTSKLKLALGNSTTIDRYVCFTNEKKDQVWIEKLTSMRSKRWFVFNDTIKIDDDNEWNEVFNFLKDRKILE